MHIHSVGGNSSGKDRLPPVFIHTSENPRGMPRGEKHVEDLGVIYHFNASAWMTRALFQGWFDNYFVPLVNEISCREGLEPRALLVLDNATVHAKDLAREHDNIRVLYMPPNTSCVLQPMDQCPIAAFKAHYTRLVMDAAMDAMKSKKEAGDSSFRFIDYLKSLKIRQAIEFVRQGWELVKNSTLRRSWHKIYPSIKALNWSEDGDQLEEETTISGELADEAQDLLEDVPPEDTIDYFTIGAPEFAFIRAGFGDAHVEPLVDAHVEPLVEVDENVPMMDITGETGASQFDSFFTENSENFINTQLSSLTSSHNSIECKHKRKLRKLFGEIQNTIERMTCDCKDCDSQKRKNKHN